MGFQQRIDVWNETKAVAAHLTSLPSLKVICNQNLGCVVPRYDGTKVNVVTGDTIDVALLMAGRGLNPLVLNMADDTFPGGCVALGSGAQEESLFRRTNLVSTLRQQFYPLVGEQAVYSPRVSVFRANESRGYHFVRIRHLDFVSCPAIRNPALVDGHLSSDQRRAFSNKLKTVFQLGIAKGHGSLVLGAWGCGAWNCPAEDVARLIKSAVHSMDGWFQEVAIAVLPGAEQFYTTKTNNADNLAVFSSVFHPPRRNNMEQDGLRQRKPRVTI